MKLKAVLLNNGDPYRPLRLKVYDYEASGKHRLLGQVDTNTAKLAEAHAAGAQLVLEHPSKPGPCGHLLVKGFQAEVHPSFLDYVSAGVEISFMVAVDFTGSNGMPSDPASLHYMSPNGSPTPYEEAIMGVGKVLDFYDNDRKYPAFGFGGQQPHMPVSHCFPLNHNPANPECDGIPGIIQAYRKALTIYGLSGPTLFTPIIKAAMAHASQPTAHLRYNVLLILTDGEIMDMDDTVSAIIQAAQLPMSILIVGIGNSEFANMEILDGDKVRLAAHGKTAERDIVQVRDIVQFVEFRNFKNRGDALAAELLAELPGQFLAYCRARNIMPPAAPPPPAGTVEPSAASPQPPAAPAAGEPALPGAPPPPPVFG